MYTAPAVATQRAPLGSQVSLLDTSATSHQALPDGVPHTGSLLKNGHRAAHEGASGRSGFTPPRLCEAPSFRRSPASWSCPREWPSHLDGCKGHRCLRPGTANRLCPDSAPIWQEHPARCCPPPVQPPRGCSVHSVCRHLLRLIPEHSITPQETQHNLADTPRPSLYPGNPLPSVRLSGFACFGHFIHMD